MATFKFYANLDYDFSKHKNKIELSGLTLSGFNELQPLHIKDFDKLTLNVTCNIIACHLNTIKTIIRSYFSYSLKHFVKHVLTEETNSKINYISNDTLILAMIDARYKFKRKTYNPPNCYFYVAKKM